MKNKIYYCFLIFLSLVFINCSPEDGEMGPPGPQGEQGPQGEEGAPGTANIMYSEWMDIVWDVNDPTSKVMLIEEPIIDEEFINSGGFALMYVKEDLGGGNFSAIPLPVTSGNDQIIFGMSHEDGFLTGLLLLATSNDGTTPIQLDFSNIQVRYILIPGGTQIGGKPMETAWQNINKANYQQVVEFLNIQP